MKSKSHCIYGVALYALVALSFAAGCQTRPVANGKAGLSAEHAVLEGDVIGPSGEAIAGALVSISSHFDLQTTDIVYELTSDNRGHFRFMTVPSGRYGISVTHNDHAAGYGGIVELPRAEDRPVVVRMGGVGIVVEGIVRDEHNEPMANARIQAPALSENEFEVYVAHTDSRGHYLLRLPTDYGYFIVTDVPPRPRTNVQVEPKDQVLDLHLDALPAPRPGDEAITEWLRQRAKPLVGDHDLNEASAQAMGAVVGNASIVALGEATHGSGEFTEWRRRIFQALVRDKGFTVYAVETGWAEAFALDEYVVFGRGDPYQAIRALGAWKDETLEMVALAQWMRSYNADPAHPNKVHFAGFDPLTANAVPELIAYLRKVDPSLVSQTEKTLAPLMGITADSSYPGLSIEVQQKTRNSIDVLVKQMDDSRAAYVTRSNDSEWARGRQLARVIQQAEVAFRDYVARDEFMFENVRWLVDHSLPGTKFVLDAHNAHIAAGGHSIVYMGRRLREQFGKDYVPIGFAFGEGSFFALDWREAPSNRSGDFAVGRAKRGTFDGDLSTVGLGDFVIDLRTADGPIAAWLRSPQSMHHIGGRFYGAEKSFETFVPSRDFDAILYVDKVSAIHRLEPQ